MINTLFRIIGRVAEEAWEEAPLNPIATLYDNPALVRSPELVVKYQFENTVK